MFCNVFCSMYSCDQQTATTCGVRGTKNKKNKNDSINGLEFIRDAKDTSIQRLQ